MFFLTVQAGYCGGEIPPNTPFVQYIMPYSEQDQQEPDDPKVSIEQDAAEVDLYDYDDQHWRQK
jgi:hypothetical protein